MTASPPMIEASGIGKRYDDRWVLRDIDLTVYPGEVVAIIGPSGCGKSTLLKVISGLEDPTQGHVQLHDDNMSMVFQYSALFDSLTVFENVAFKLMERPDNDQLSHNVRARKACGPRRRCSEAEMRAVVKEKLALLGLTDIESLYPSQLSGGMQKRVSFARAIVGDPAIILYDEPTAGLDPIASTMMENYILKLSDELGAASVVVTHQPSTIQRCADRIILLFDQKIQWHGTVDAFYSTDNPFAHQFAHAELDGPMTIAD
ncbi:MAG: ATP-binding cassette domain-containing protein [Vampirovibrionales bacterium]